jgi:solute carrier family 45 protein 1/2/4
MSQPAYASRTSLEGDGDDGDGETQFLIGEEEERRERKKGGEGSDDESMEGPDQPDHEDGGYGDARSKPPRPPAASAGIMGNAEARQSVLAISHAKPSGDDDDDDDGDGHPFPPPRIPGAHGPHGMGDIEPDSIAAKAGIILGIHNVFLVIPQFLSTCVSFSSIPSIPTLSHFKPFIRP